MAKSGTRGVKLLQCIQVVQNSIIASAGSFVDQLIVAAKGVILVTAQRETQGGVVSG